MGRFANEIIYVIIAKKAWLGCGRHIPTALAGVPEADWCTCEPKVEVDGKKYPPAALQKSRKSDEL